jgi:hypothetical protein
LSAAFAVDAIIQLFGFFRWFSRFLQLVYIPALAAF